MAKNGESVTETDEKKERNVRPLYVMLPALDEGTYEVHECVGYEEAREVLVKSGIDRDEERLAKVVIIRGDKISLRLKTQTTIAFGNR